MTAHKKELSVGPSMGYQTQDALMRDPEVQAWIIWGQINGIKVAPSYRNYYNLPSRSPERHDEPTQTRPSQFYWELRAEMDEYPEDCPVTEMRHAVMEFGPTAEAVAAATANRRNKKQTRKEKSEADKAHAQDLLARAKSFVPKGLMTGTRMADDLVSKGGECLELVKACSAGHITYDQIRAAIA